MALEKQKVTASSILKRMDALESENRKLRDELRNSKRWQGMLTAAVVAVSMATTMLGLASHGESPKPVGTSPGNQFPSVIEAEGFVVKDARGKIHAVLGKSAGQRDPDHPIGGLELFGDGKPRAEFAVQPNGFVTLTMNDQAGEDRVTIAAGTQEVDLELDDSRGTPRFAFNLYENDNAAFAMNGLRSGCRLQTGVRASGDMYLDLFDRDGEIVRLIDSSGRPAIGNP